MLNTSKSCDRMIWEAELVGNGDGMLVVDDVDDGEADWLLELCVPFIVESEAEGFAGDPFAARLTRKMFIALSSCPTPELPPYAGAPIPAIARPLEAACNIIPASGT